MRSFRALIVLCLLALPLGAAAAQQTPLPTNPHGPLRPGMDCSDCHTSAGWKTMRPDARFDHSRETRFALTGAHATLTCARCHLDKRFDEPKVEQNSCAGCHVDVHRGSFTGECIRCHNTNDFKDVASISLHQRTGFPLTGAHINAPCESCHKTERSGTYAAIPRDCAACHRSALDQANAAGVDHTNFPSDCAQCHATLAWRGGANFDHVTVSGGFRLEGAHALQQCAGCHVVPGFASKFSPAPTGPTDCNACHAPIYQQQHGGGFPTTCADCHNVRTWAGATVDHVAISGGYPLEGAHSNATCTACHVVPGYAVKFAPAPTGPTDCYSCHRSDYQSKHAAQGYPTDCTTCHTVNSWSSTFNHDAAEFPIFSGAHRGRWPTCATCHTTPGDAKVFTCLTCHEHSQSSMDSKHQGRNGYSYDSQACYNCHPRGTH